MGEEIPNAQVFAPLFRRCAHPHESACLHDVSCQYLEISGNLQNPRNFGYTFNAMGHLTAVSENTNLNNYAAAVTNDANGNITQVTETWNGQFPLASTLAYDYENRLTQHATGMLGITVAHKYDGLGRLVRTDRTTQGPTTTQFEHVRDGLKLVGNIDATNANTAPTWTNKPGALRPVESQQVVTNSATQYINVSDEISPARRTYNPSTSAAGDTEAIAAKGRLVLVNGSTPALTASLAVNPSELFSQRNMTYNENSIALPSDRGTLEISGANLMYEGARVKSWMLGRDLNPGGRGYGDYFPHGMFQIGNLRPQPTSTPTLGYGNSINNLCCPGKNEDPTQPPPPPPCAPGYCHGMEGCNCCSSCGGDPADKCCCSCETAKSKTDPYFAPGCILFGNVGFCPYVPFTFADDHCKRLKERTDMAYIGEFCAYQRSIAACYGYYCPWDDPSTGWACCHEYCTSVGFGGGGTGPGGSGGGGGFGPPSGGGCGSCANSDRPGNSSNYILDSSACCAVRGCMGNTPFTKAANIGIMCTVGWELTYGFRLREGAQKLLNCLSCWIEVLKNDPGKGLPNVGGHQLLLGDIQCMESWLLGGHGPIICKHTNARLFGGAGFMYDCYGAAGCGGCQTYPEVGAYACGACNICGVIGYPYILICQMALNSPIDFCLQGIIIGHELMHHCHPGCWSHVPGGPTNEDLNKIAELLLSCCYSECE